MLSYVIGEAVVLTLCSINQEKGQLMFVMNASRIS